MTASHTPWQIALLPYLLRDDEALIGDLIEEWPRRSSAWFWSQVVFAMSLKAMTGASAILREPHRLAGGLAHAGIFVILSFQVAVMGSLLDDVLRRVDRVAQMTLLDYPGWLIFIVLSSLPAAWTLGRAMSRVHERSRLATVLACGAAAAISGWMTVSLLRSDAAWAFFPSVAHQIAAAMVFLLGLRAGTSHEHALTDASH